MIGKMKTTVAMKMTTTKTALKRLLITMLMKELNVSMTTTTSIKNTITTVMMMTTMMTRMKTTVIVMTTTVRKITTIMTTTATTILEIEIFTLVLTNISGYINW